MRINYDPTKHTGDLYDIIGALYADEKSKEEIIRKADRWMISETCMAVIVAQELRKKRDFVS